MANLETMETGGISVILCVLIISIGLFVLVMYLSGTPQGTTLGTRGMTAILFALAALHSVPQAGSQFRGRSK